jgi:NAD(P)-dependent dehydrogenase (short-subunit alcohol dehydrogenase family)
MIHFSERETFVVTGASSGIGWATALRLHDLGATVVGVGRDTARLEALRAATGASPRMHMEQKDLTEDVEALHLWVRELKDRYGPLKGLILAAGMQQTIPLQVMAIDQAKALFNLNYFSNISLARGFCDRRVNAGLGSSIVFISSTVSLRPVPGIISYSASKGAVDAAVRAMAVELARLGIRINAVSPGFVRTPMVESWEQTSTEEHLQQRRKQHPLGFGRPEDVADACCFLVSQSARWITGHCLVIDGGGSVASST